MDDLGISCDVSIDAEARSFDEETKLFQQILKKKKQPVKHKFLCFTCIFINYHYIIDSC